MSEERCIKFQSDASNSNLILSKRKKECASIQSYLFKNQNVTWSESAQSALFNAIETHVTYLKNEPLDDNPLVDLLREALKMPFNVMSSARKNKILKWYDKILPVLKTEFLGKQEECTVMEIDDENVMVILADGKTTKNLSVTLFQESLLETVRERFDENECVILRLGFSAKGVSVLGISEITIQE